MPIADEPDQWQSNGLTTKSTTPESKEPHQLGTDSPPAPSDYNALRSLIEHMFSHPDEGEYEIKRLCRDTLEATPKRTRYRNG